ASATGRPRADITRQPCRARAACELPEEMPLALTCGRRRSHPDALGSLARPSEATGKPEWGLTLHKQEGDTLGVGLGNTSTGAVIFNIPEGGLVARWNEANQRRLYPGQIITEVNGVRGYWPILEELSRPGVLALTISNTRRRTRCRAGSRISPPRAAGCRSRAASSFGLSRRARTPPARSRASRP
ncbi:unnamed protein product, partial [Prorocentrum cordatum]